MLVYSWLSAIRIALSRPDVVHVHALGPSVPVLLFKILRIPVVVTCHGLDYNREKWGILASTYIKLGELVSAYCADEVIVVSQTLRDHFYSRFGRRTLYIPNGADTIPKTLADNRLLAELGLSRHEYILFAGRIVECKEGR